MIITSNLQQIRDYFYKGYILAYPTDTVYGLGVNVMNEDAVSLLNKLKDREVQKKGYVLLVKDVNMLKKFAIVTKKNLQIIEFFKDKSVSFVLKAGYKLPSWVIGPNGTVAFRVSSDNFTKNLFKYISVPLVSTSANWKGFSFSRDALEVAAYFGSCDKLVIVKDVWNVNKMGKALPSTIIDLSNDCCYKVLRQGSIRIVFPQSNGNGFNPRFKPVAKVKDV